MNERPTLELSADRVRADDGAFLITMPGDMPDDLAARTRQIMFEHGIPQGSDDPAVRMMGAPPLGPVTDPPGRVPPSVLVALNQPCPTCDGCAHLCTDGVNNIRCPDCDGSGRLVFDLKTPCEWCSEPAGWLLGEPNHYETGSDAWVPCECNPDEADPGPGTVTHRVWLDPEWGIHELPDNGIVAWANNVLPSAARPGDYVARTVRVAE